MRRLDCTTLETALESCSDLLSISDGELRAALSSFVYDRCPEEARHAHPYQDLLCLHLGMELRSLPVPDLTVWFHATRVDPGVEFADGILPLSKSIDRIWDYLGRLARDWHTPEDWAEFRRRMRGQGASQYWTKFAFQPGGGPYAFLVRPMVQLGVSAGNHDYLEIPEIVEDICLSHAEMFGSSDLRTRFVTSTQPCVVKFRSSKAWHGTVRAALMFVHCALRGESLWHACNTCFDGEGDAIPSHDIIEIEWLKGQPPGEADGD